MGRTWTCAWTLVHGRAVGTPKHPKINQLHISSRTGCCRGKSVVAMKSRQTWSKRFIKSGGVTNRRVSCRGVARTRVCGVCRLTGGRCCRQPRSVCGIAVCGCSAWLPCSRALCVWVGDVVVVEDRTNVASALVRYQFRSAEQCDAV